jgi:hypothetical protein
MLLDGFESLPLRQSFKTQLGKQAFMLQWPVRHWVHGGYSPI